MFDHHMELGKTESISATIVSTWEKFVSAVENELGHSLDGTQWIEGYSLDHARDYFNDECNNYQSCDVARYVRGVKLDKDLIAKGEYITRLSEKSFKSDNEDGEESRWDEITLYVGNATDAYIAKYIDDYFPSEHCQHEYDCCGHWYAYRPTYKRHGVLVVLKQLHYQNI